MDLGCGNGLLTFLLKSEGYDGYGIDIADRKIWPALCKNHTQDMLRGKLSITDEILIISKEIICSYMQIYSGGTLSSTNHLSKY